MSIGSLHKEARRLSRISEGDRRPIEITRWLVLGGVFLLVVLLTSTYFLRPLPPGGDDEIRGEVRVQAPFSIVLPSAQEQWEREVEQQHRRFWIYDPAAQDRVLRELDNLFTATNAIDPAVLAPADLTASIRRIDSRLSVSEENVVDFLTTLRDERFREATRDIIKEAFRDYFVAENPLLLKSHVLDNVATIRGGLPASAGGNPQSVRLLSTRDFSDWSPLLIERFSSRFFFTQNVEGAREVAGQLLFYFVQPNITLNQPETDAARRRMAENPQIELTAVYSTLGQILVQAPPAGQRRILQPSDELHSVLTAHREAVRQARWKRLPGHMIYILIVFIILSFYIRKQGNRFNFTTFNVFLIAQPVLVALGIMVFVLLMADGNPGPVGFLFPAGMIGMLGVLLLDVRMALLLVTWGCLLFALQVDLEYDFVIVGLFGGYTAVAALYTIRKRYEVFVASILIGLVNVAVVLCTWFIRQTLGTPLALSATDESTLIWQAGSAFINGLGSFLVLAILPIFERFGIITDMQLLELTGLHHPLLRKLEEEAPGTWQHTLNVSKLAEAAATEIGVNYLLVRAGCYYHDVGKMSKPEYFTENQITPEDKMRHSELKPQMSALIIKNHVKEGIEMAREAGLPERVLDFIREHHGTSAIAYFYHKALEAHARGETKEPVRIEDYRYPYVKPQTIETAIVMLADSVEATATAKLSNRTVREDDIQQVVRTTIFDKFNDGQFNECNLTLRDLEVIRETFVAVLKSRFHTRIDYPRKSIGGGAAPTTKAPTRDEAPRKSATTETKRMEMEKPAGSNVPPATAT